MALFGTDGIRGVPNRPPLDLKTVSALGRAVGIRMRGRKEAGALCLVRDSRRSGPFLSSALAAGLMAEGIDLFLCGVLPTPACAVLVRQWGLGGGVVISASHNPSEDNGIKFFNSNGLKLDRAEEEALEAQLQDLPEESTWTGRVGFSYKREDALQTYLSFLRTAVGELNLSGLHLVLDCANGAMSEAAPRIFSQLGARLSCMHAQPDGTNINEQCGSEHPQSAVEKVRQLGAQGGVIFDGDGDRVILVDERGTLLSGDHILAALALHLAREDALPHKTVVCTEYSNKGLDLSLAEHGIRVERHGVGDRDVAYRLFEKGYALGGEQSGHVILPFLLPTGDGLLTALKVLQVAVRSGKSLRELADILQVLPQVLLNVPVAVKIPLAELTRTRNTIEDVKRALGARGRIYVRYSGTQNLLRIMVEGEDYSAIRSHAEAVAETATAEIDSMVLS